MKLSAVRDSPIEQTPPLQARPEASLEFLRLLYPNGPWALTSIDLEKRRNPPTRTRTFYPGEESQLHDWIECENAACNIYFSVNRIRQQRVDKKASKRDIGAVHFLHVDVDPRPGEALGAEQERIRARLLEAQPAPTFVIFSGGGYQGLWRLSEPVSLSGEDDCWTHLESFNARLEADLGGDHCHNIDRILRVPGTVNWPDERKRLKGRLPALAELVENGSDPERALPLSDFKTLASQGPTAPVAPGTSLPDSSESVRRVSLDDLPPAVSAKTKSLISNGLDPEFPAKYPSRSEPLHRVCCDLVRASVEDDVIYSVITDPRFAISASVLDTGARADAYARRQIERAHEAVVAPELLEMNDRYHTVLNVGGKCRVVEEVVDYLGHSDDGKAISRPRLTVISFPDFKNAYANRFVDVPSSDPSRPPKRVSLGAWWIQHPLRRQVDRVEFAPGRNLPGIYNLWRGFACEPKPGDASLFLAHMRDNVCSGNEAHFEYLLGWMARAVQNPGSPGESAIVLRGGQGVGKSFFAKAFGDLFGRHFMQVADARFLVGNFNWHLRDCVVLFADEAFYAGDRQHRSVLKALVTERLRVYEKKGIDAETGPNFTHLIMASNSEWVVPAEIDDRRFFVLDVATLHKGDHSYFAAIQRQLETGGREALLHLLLQHDLSNFNVRAVPKTSALDDQRDLTLPPVEHAWLECLREGQLPGSGEADGHRILSTATFQRHILMHNRRLSDRDVSFNAISTFLGRPPRRGESRRKYMGFRKFCGTPRGWLVPELADARRRWDEVMWPVAWDADIRAEGESDVDLEVRLGKATWSRAQYEGVI